MSGFRISIFTILLLFFSHHIVAQEMKGDELKSMEKYGAVKERDGVSAPGLKLSERQMQKWRNMKFGMFIHWGLYAIPGKGEWVMFKDKIPMEEYDKLTDQFNPKHFDATLWAKIAKEAGMKYMVLTARHHDGFALWNSPSSYLRFDSYNRAAHRDFVQEYTQACRKAGLGVGIYYSLLDWRFPGYFKPTELEDNAQLLKKQCYGQVEELMKNYGQIDMLWYDGGWLAHKGKDADAAWFWEPVKLNRMVRKYQPHVVINPRSGWEGDFQCNEGGRAVQGPIIYTPWEKCLNLNQTSWGYNPNQRLMTLKEILTMLVNTVDRGGNMLLNVGPDADGVIPESHIERLKEVGSWLQRYGQSIYGTRPGPFEPVDNLYGSVHKGNRIYIHLLAQKEALQLPPFSKKIVKCSDFANKPLKFSQDEKGITILLENLSPDEEIHTLVLETK